MAFNTTSKRRQLAALAIIAAQLALACGGGGDKLDPSVPSSVAATSTTALQAIAGSSVAEKPSIIVKDQRGNPMANVSVTFAAVLGGGTVSGASQTTSSTGIATVGDWVLGATAGPNALTATASGLSPLTFAATGVAGSASAIVKSTGDGQSVTVGSAVPIVPSVMVTDANGNPLAGAAVSFMIGSGGGSITGFSATTGANGVATLGSWTLGTIAGPNALMVTSGSLPPAVFTATAVADAPAKLGLVTQPGTASVGAPITAAPVVHVQDQYGNLITTATTSVTASLASGEGTLGGTVAVTAVAGVATFSNLVISDFTSDGTATLRFSASGLTPAASSGLTLNGSVVNLTIDGVHLTQSTQTYQGSVPLIAGRAGLIRVFVKASRANSLTPAVRVRLYRNGSLVQTETIDAPTLSVPTAVNEGSLTSSWNVAVAANVMQTGLSILADVDPSGTVAEGNPSDNSFPVSGTPAALDVRTASTLKVTLVPVVQSGNNLQGDVTEANKHGYLEFATRIYPLSSYDAVVRAPYTFIGALANNYGPTWIDLLAQINALRVNEGLDRHFYGVIKPDYISGGTGMGFLGMAAAIGVDWSSPIDGSTLRAVTAAHEWGHNFNRLHIACGDPSGPDPLYPHDPNSIGAHGYDATSGALLPLLSFVDLMTYCQPRWISDYTYKAVINFRAASGGASAAGAPRRSLLVWGRIGPDGVVLEPSFEIDARPSLPTRAGPYRIHATDAAGRAMFSFSFAGNEIDHAPNHRLFAFVVPLPAGQARPAAIRLTANGRESVRRSSLLPGPLGNAPITPAPARLDRIGGPRSRLEWDARAYPMALVRDPATGQILSFARGGRLDIAVPGQELDVTFSDGVNSTRQRIRVAPR
ncbi:MAG: hypothetical protein WEA80_03415 [Gemmatimonadaceae bacterium]